MAIDIIFAIVLLYGFYVGYSRGIIGTVFTVLSIVFGLMAAFKFAPAATRFLETAFNSNSPLMFLAGFILAFVGTMLLIRFLARGLEGILQTININFINQIAGGILLSAIMVLIYSVLLMFAERSHMITDDTRQRSMTYPYLQQFPDQMQGVYAYTKPIFLEFWDESVEFMDKMEEMSVKRNDSNPNIFDIEDNNSTDTPPDNEY